MNTPEPTAGISPPRRVTPDYITLTGPGGHYTFDFWDSIHAGETGEEATEYDVLACLEWDCPSVFADFCADFGYDEDSRKAYKTWTATLAQCRALHRIFPSESARESLTQIR